MRRRRTTIGLTLLACAVLGAASVILSRGAGMGPLVSAVPVGANLYPLAVDTRTGRAFVVDRSDNVVSVIDSRTGALLRTVQAAGPASYYDRSIAVAEQAGLVFLAGFDGAINVLDAHSGRLVRTITVVGSPILLSVAEGAGRVYVGSFSDNDAGNVSLLDVHSGRLLRVTPTGLVPQAMVADARTQRLFVIGDSNAGPGAAGSIGVLDMRSGRLLRTITTGPLVGRPAVDERSGRVFVVEAASQGSRVLMLDARNGRLLHVTPVPVGLDGLAVAIDRPLGRVLVGGNAGRVCILDADSGRLLHTVMLGHETSAPLVDERSGRAFVVNFGTNTVSTLAVSSGAILNTVFVGAGVGPAAIDERASRIFISVASMASPRQLAASNGHVSVLDATSGAIVETMPAGIGPFAIAIDERAGRAFVLDGGGVAAGPDPWSWLPRWLRSRLSWLPSAPRGITTGAVSVLDTSR